VPPSAPPLAGKLPPQFIPSSYHPHPHPLYLRCPRSGGGPSPSSPTPSRPPVLNLGGTRVSAAGICTTRQRTQDSLLHVKERTNYVTLSLSPAASSCCLRRCNSKKRAWPAGRRRSRDTALRSPGEQLYQLEL
jgi:hypothetical protein